MCNLNKVTPLHSKNGKIPYWVIILKDEIDEEGAKEVIESLGYKNLRVADKKVERIYSESTARSLLFIINARTCQLRKLNGKEAPSIKDFLDSHKNTSGS